MQNCRCAAKWRNTVRSVLFAVVCCITFAVFRGAPAQRVVPTFQPERVVPRMPPLTQFEIKRSRDIEGGLNPSELVIGITVGDQARAYPINMLTGPRREIINDTLGGQAIAATW